MTSEDGRRAMASANVVAIAEFLEGERIAYELVEHDPAMGPASDALGPNTGIAPKAADICRE